MRSDSAYTPHKCGQESRCNWSILRQGATRCIFRETKGNRANRFNCVEMSKTTCPITIRFRDTDTMGHVNNAVYLSYFELARMDYFDKMMNSRWDWTKDGIILARNEIDYLAPVFLLDKIYVETEVVHVGNSSFTMAY